MLPLYITKIADLYDMCNTRFGDALISILNTPNDQPQGTIRCARIVMTVLRISLRRDTWDSYLTWSFLLGLLLVDVVIFAAFLTSYIVMVMALKPAGTGTLIKLPSLVNYRGKMSRTSLNNSRTLVLPDEEGSIGRARRML
ncbi:hypothetical protein V1520DRAFT_345236 [Lipomyces starkeyi]|uniref:Uncharacterized protein n=1 Tax=Lipomyces starkeyi NRRL Y-11557 TaxID=675824 RepID=A0A1E3QD14_LIPST|nr:hypothetical protein LIPSTDRAFT_69125 [Lipomyces starkeyi NRRL Y-11557]